MPPDDGFAKYTRLSQLRTLLLRLRVAQSWMSAEHFDRNSSSGVRRSQEGFDVFG
jgi:hypothetical protein